MKIPCYSCGATTELEVGFEVLNFSCPKCFSVYGADNEGKFRRKSQYKNHFYDCPLEVGAVGFLKGSEYTITGILRKNVHPHYTWTEFILHNKEEGFLYLSLSNGHWMMLTEMEEVFDVKHHPKVLVHENQYYNIFEYSDAEIINAKGFFDFVLPNNKLIHLVEYIKPPYIVSVETMYGEQTAFYGEYVDKNEIKKAFPEIILPIQSGVSMIQPFRFDIANTALIFCFFALLIITANWYIYKDQVEQNVFEKTIRFSEFDNREITSESFVLNGASAPATIKVSTGVDNSWANVNVALINENTSDEIYANKDIEYYHGYSDGESWTEGSQSEKFNICGVSAGKYHLLITPMKAPEDLNNGEMQVSVTWNEPSNQNAWMIIILMIIVFGVIYFLKHLFEKKRWIDSSYSPYSE